ncbi:MAG: TIGR04219 family outer membrane beta-barrel protein [Gammaproteobacteria bacterium]|nr:TIGR04219 family outer membrane beta-barrel protein [Gammaproteobacteria bacterium]
MDIKAFISRVLISSLVLFSGAISGATLVDAEIGVGAWFYDSLGNINHQGTTADVDTELKLDDDAGSVSYIILEHSLPNIPNIRLKQMGLTSSGGGTVSGAGFTFGGTSYVAGDAITTELVLDHTDVSLYYRIFDTVVDLDLGVTIMMLEGRAEVTRAGVINRKLIDIVVPMAHYKLGLELPYPGFRFQFDGSHMDMSDGYFCSLDSKIIYSPDTFYGVEVGYRDEKFKFDGKEGLYSDIDYEGPFVNLFVHF